MTKEEIRKAIRKRKSLLSDAEKHDAASKVFTALEKFTPFINAKKVLLYHSLPDELPTHEFIEKWHTKKSIFLPRVNGDNLEILPYKPTTLQFGAYNIKEPNGNDITNINDIELIIVPAIAYDRNGNRIGRGKGYYDRLLSKASATKIGVGYDFQLIDTIKTEPHDIAMDLIITVSNIVYINNPIKKTQL